MEGEVRAYLRRQGLSRNEIDDVVQDAYVALSRLDSVAHIAHPRSYFLTTARNALLQQLRHRRVVRIDSLSEVKAFDIADDAPGPERNVTSRMEMERIQRLIDDLPPRCREIFVLRRVQGVPQREIATRMGVSEKVVEAQAIRGLKLILRRIEQEDGDTGAMKSLPARNLRSYDDDVHG